MKKVDFVKNVVKKTGYMRKDCEVVVDAVFDELVELFKNNDEMRIANFGTFKNVQRAARTARNVKTGEMIDVPARLAPTFKAAPALKDKVNGQ